MRVNFIATRYARALIALTGLDSKTIDENKRSFLSIHELFSLDEFAKILKSPVIPSKLKSDVLGYVLTQAQASKVFANFVDSVLLANRVTLLPDMSAAYDMLVDEQRNLIHAQVTVAEEWSDEQKKSLNSVLEHVFQKKILPTFKNEAQVLGGFIVKTRYHLIDCSVKHKINSLISNVATTSGT